LVSKHINIIVRSMFYFLINGQSAIANYLKIWHADHMSHANQLELLQALEEEADLLERAAVPIVTVSATYKKELAKHYHLTYHTAADVVYSRAHYSMAEAVYQAALAGGHTSHLVDPTNFVSEENWKKIEFTQKVGRLMARHKLLKWIKDQIDTVVRSNLPITKPITPPLRRLTKNVHRPIIAMHYEVGNLLVREGHQVIQTLTDPHVRPQYLDPLPSVKSKKTAHPHLKFSVFDEATQTAFFKTAVDLGKLVDPNQVVVTGPPIDPRIAKLAKRRKSLRSKRPVNLAVTTGGLGTNLSEIKQVLDDLRPLLLPPENIRLFLYGGIHRDFRDFFENFAAENHVRIGNLDDPQARIRILYEDSIIDANENLIKYMFPWADIVVTKPSGDMAYDAAAAGCGLLFLEPWGEWEQNIQKVFVGLGVGFDLHVDTTLEHFKRLLTSGKLYESTKAAQTLPDLFRHGGAEIVKLQQNFNH